MKHSKSLRAIVLAVITILVISDPASSQSWNPGHSVGTVNGVYHYAYNQTPAQLVEVQPAGIPNTGLTYQWESSTSAGTGFSNISGATANSYTIPGPLTQTTYYRRKTTRGFETIYSNVIKIQVVSVNWEDLNYIREHVVTTTAVTSWTAVDQLAIGPKEQTTTYIDGMGRSLQKVSRETAVPSSGSLWGDVVQFNKYDVYGRETTNYLPYATTTESGKFKTTSLTEQPQYYTANYNESSAFSSVVFDNSPLNRVTNGKKPGISWAASSGTSILYEVNTAADNVQIFSVDYIQGNPPVHAGAYPPGSLYKVTAINENGKKEISYSNKSRQLILKKVQLDDTPSASYTGWICTYNVYDDFGRIRCQIEPEGVKYLDANSWSFAGVNGQQILNEQCFLYNYDARGKLVWKKTPGAAPLNMIYDLRERLVFMQDGNQGTLPTPQWTVNLYDEFDRSPLTTLYNTTKTIADLKTDLANAPAIGSVTIANPANTGGANFTLSLSLNPLSATNLNNTATCIVLNYMFYDHYSYAGAKAFNTNYTNLSAYNTSDPNVVPITASNRTLSMQTGMRTRVLNGNTFLSATHYYDERGQLTQVLRDNIKSGTDILTLQHHFDGRVLSSCSDHTTASSGYTNFKILTKRIFDKLGRVISLDKQFGTNAMKTVASYQHDDLGRIKTARMDPGYTAGGNADLESLNYSYNIHGRLTGINKDYALKTPGNYDQWGHFFGMYIGYDNRDNHFSAANLSGQITGAVWKTQGDKAQRKLNYVYDNSGRLTNANFTEQLHPGDGWTNGQMDFSVSGATGKITYDLNGNLLNMLQKGVIPGNATPLTIDNLAYAYTNYSNKLQSVTDQMTNTAVNGQFGDIKDGSNGAGVPDYVYDNNGNVVLDLNKNVQSVNGGAPGTSGITYNYFDKPELIRIVGKGTVRIVYSANGEKLQRAFIPEAGGPASVTSYINEYTYQESVTITTSTPSPLGGVAALSSINFEEGRIRVITPVSQNNMNLDILTVDGNMDLPGGKKGVYDFYVMDNIQNVRMVLTEEIHVAANTATMETTNGRPPIEEAIFGQTGAANEVQVTRFTKPSGWTNSSVGNYVSRTGTNSGYSVGPNTLQKVMAGDKVSTSVQYYYVNNAGGNNTNFVSTVLGSLLQAISGGNAAGQLVKNNASTITTGLGNASGFVNAVQPGGSNPPGNTPQAFLTVLFFDERFNFISATDGGLVQQQVASSVGSNGDILAHANVRAPENGYAFVYVSNQSNEDVYFDNLNVSIVTGNIIEENHYYSFGMKMAAISSQKLGDSYEGELKNGYLFQGAYNEMDDDIGWNDFTLRNYDPQIGRWIQQDPYQQSSSPYLGMGNDPINNIDPSGGIYIPPGGGLSTTAATAITLSEVVVTAVSRTSKAISIVSGVSKAISITTTSLKIAFTTANIINGSMTTSQAGQPPEGGDDIDKRIISMLNSISTSMNEKLDEAWKNSFKNGGLLESDVEEWNFTVSRTFMCKQTKYHVRNFHTDHDPGSSNIEMAVPDGEEAFGAAHTHPYSVEEGSRLGVGASAGDINGLRNFSSEGAFIMIESGTKRFAVVIVDPVKAEAFFNNNSIYDIQDKWDREYNARRNRRKKFQKKVDRAVKAVIGDGSESGIRYYGTDKSKFKFKRL